MGPVVVNVLLLFRRGQCGAVRGTRPGASCADFRHCCSCGNPIRWLHTKTVSAMIALVHAPTMTCYPMPTELSTVNRVGVYPVGVVVRHEKQVHNIWRLAVRHNHVVHHNHQIPVNTKPRLPLFAHCMRGRARLPSHAVDSYSTVSVDRERKQQEITQFTIVIVRPTMLWTGWLEWSQWSRSYCCATLTYSIRYSPELLLPRCSWVIGSERYPCLIVPEAREGRTACKGSTWGGHVDPSAMRKS